MTQKTTETQKRHFIIGTDANYLHKALVFYESLKQFESNFVLHLFCFDDITYRVLKKLAYEDIVPYQPSDYETEDLLKVKASKKRQYEYYWTINPAMGKEIIGEQDADFIALADCDLMFFQSPEVLFDEYAGADVIIQPNNFSSRYVNDFVPVGYYCTSLQCFRNNDNGRRILDDWYSQCMEWCSSDFEEGKFGDQKYLDDWKIKYENVREVANPGANVAPWNILKFELSEKDGQVVINNKWPLVYYHYHSFRMNLDTYEYIITGDRSNSYNIPPAVLELVYKPYIKRMIEVLEKLKQVDEYREYVQFNPGGLQKDFSGEDVVFEEDKTTDGTTHAKVV
ncbi:MAG TPA: putative nucleotide-diphospho-sugar transferase [Patescibacteria group bacterium]|nr:putative nucleotide-diphospho-sugar transferase [Patescibacteria group bacterium]